MYSNLNLTSNIVGVIKSRRMKWAGCMREMINVYKSSVRKPQGRDLLGDLGTDGRI
jgi:hypothetical protein